MRKSYEKMIGMNNNRKKYVKYLIVQIRKIIIVVAMFTIRRF